MRAWWAAFFILAGCATPGEKAAFVPATAESALIRWQRGPHVSLRTATCETSASGAVRVTLGEAAGARRFDLQPDGWMTAEGWAGQAGSAPVRLVTWAAFLTLYQHASALPPGRRELHTPSAWIAVDRTERGLRSVSIRSLDTPETLSANFRGPVRPGPSER